MIVPPRSECAQNVSIPFCPPASYSLVKLFLQTLILIYRPRVTISINAPGEQVEQDLLTLDLPPSLTLADLKNIVQGDTNLPANAQQYYYNGLPVRDDAQSLDALGLKDGEMLAMMVNRRTAGQSSGAQQAQRAPTQAQRATGGNFSQEEAQVETTRQRIAADPASVMQLIQAQPRLAEAINDPQRFMAIWHELKVREREEQAQRENEIAMLNDDPFNADAQQRIAEIIRRERIEENRQYAYENNPEGTSSPRYSVFNPRKLTFPS